MKGLTRRNHPKLSSRRGLGHEDRSKLHKAWSFMYMGAREVQIWNSYPLGMLNSRMALIVHQKPKNSHKKRSKEWKANVRTFYLQMDATTAWTLDLNIPSFSMLFTLHIPSKECTKILTISSKHSQNGRYPTQELNLQGYPSPSEYQVSSKRSDLCNHKPQLPLNVPPNTEYQVSSQPKS